MILSHDSSFNILSCSLEILILKTANLSTLTYSVVHVHSKLNTVSFGYVYLIKKNPTKHFYKKKDKVVIVSKEGEKSLESQSILFSYKDEEGKCLIETITKDQISFSFGVNRLFSCVLDLNKEQFMEFCKEQSKYNIISRETNYL